MFKEFKKFILRGNVIDMAVGVMVGAAFQAIVNSLVKDIFTPLLSLLTGQIAFENLFVSLDGSSYATLAEAQEAGAATLNYGIFIESIISFILIAFCIFLFVKGINTLRDLSLKKKKAEEPAPTTKKCPYCLSEIPLEATRCAHCTSQLEAEDAE